MPELPEVENTARTFHALVASKVFSEVTLNRVDIRYPLQQDFIQRLEGTKIQSINRRAKYLVAHLESSDQLIIHLGMSGRLRVFEANEQIPPHNHVLFRFVNEARVFTYFDPRRFGMLWVKSPKEAEKFFSQYGKDPFDITQDQWLSLFNVARPVKLLLLDQNKISGIGNIYACEALWRAKIHPETEANQISDTKKADLLMHMRSVLSEAIEAGGSTLRDYRDPHDQIGQFQYAFAVYDREHLPCPAEECKGHIQRIVQSGRSSFLCCICQPKL